MCLAFMQSANIVVDYMAEDSWVTSVVYEKPTEPLEYPNITVCELKSPLWRNQPVDHSSNTTTYAINVEKSTEMENASLTVTAVSIKKL